MNFGSTIRLNKTGFCFLAVVILIFILYSIKNRSGDENNVIDLRKVLARSIDAAIEGGYEVVAVFNSSNLNTKSKGQTKEGANNPVTDADIKSHCSMFYGLLQAFPGVEVISEEQAKQTDCQAYLKSDKEKKSFDLPIDLPETLVPLHDVTIWIDPLDATQEFTEGLVEYVTTMVCVAVKGVPTLGIIYFPFTKTTMWAWHGHSSNIKIKETKEQLVVITSRSHKGDVSNVVKNVLKDNFILAQAGGAGYKSIQIATGNASIYIHTTEIKKWDICAGDAVIRTLGGKMTNLQGEEVHYGSSSDVVNKNGLIASLAVHDKEAKQFWNVKAHS